MLGTAKYTSLSASLGLDGILVLGVGVGLRESVDLLIIGLGPSGHSLA